MPSGRDTAAEVRAGRARHTRGTPPGGGGSNGHAGRHGHPPATVSRFAAGTGANKQVTPWSLAPPSQAVTSSGRGLRPHRCLRVLDELTRQRASSVLVFLRIWLLGREALPRGGDHLRPRQGAGYLALGGP
ncbi:hypothetical protein NDU88_000947 [Pleurodeles waltl]|uniref:Uncharacterized protein n=1 Tax=Pleurodeles waltl TaxID=8319 RepID=A0AAV7LW72_PLEWA|nr:hypothetical protein NDU88_000947 [Pleurodeles waltl]